MLELSNTERSPELRSCLGDDVVLDLVNGRIEPDRLTAVHAHLDRCPDCRRLVGEAVRESGDGSSGVHGSVPFTTFRAGDFVGRRFRVQRFIARGGMGEVYEAFDCDLQARVALKTVIPTTSDVDRAVRRLKAEVQLAHRVSHPNVCRIYDLGAHRLDADERVIHFLTMEFVDGERLSQRIARTGLTVSESTDIARQLLLGLRAAHAAGILHRDLKTDNVMLRTDADGGLSPVILDFGLARMLDAEDERLSSGVNGFLGTPCYMAPEQLQNGELSTATDVYAFGVIWFEMLTGRLPFSSRAPFQRLTKGPSKPSSIREDVPSSIDKMVLRCLTRAVEERFANTDEVLQALEATPRESVPSGLVTSVRRLPRWRVKGSVLLACSVLALLAVSYRRASSLRATKLGEEARLPVAPPLDARQTPAAKTPEPVATEAKPVGPAAAEAPKVALPEIAQRPAHAGGNAPRRFVTARNRYATPAIASAVHPAASARTRATEQTAPPASTHADDDAKRAGPASPASPESNESATSRTHSDAHPGPFGFAPFPKR